MRIRRPLGRAVREPMRSTRCGRSQTPSFATAPYAAAICTGVIAIPWPIGSVPIVEPDHLSSGGTMSGRLAGEVDPGQMAEAETADPPASRSEPSSRRA